eukprot:TRINITY_DN59568_c0_g1_i1.p1 TRINITY_DN59568_c0_g1~~TRINITY_DN59568_c0_g1_i1.p1  ORF type:complete len:554 (-),score=82.99 TRINITY_DN59568_c0_g1_i1:9-1670(-)
MPRRASTAASNKIDERCLESVPLDDEASLASKLACALLQARIDEFAREGVKALPLNVISCRTELFGNSHVTFQMVDLRTNYDLSKLSGLEMDARNAQQFIEQLHGAGRRPLWAVPVILHLSNANMVFVFTCVFRECGPIRKHLQLASPLEELENWSLSNLRGEQVSFLARQSSMRETKMDASISQMVLGGPASALAQLPPVDVEPSGSEPAAASGVSNKRSAARARRRARKSLEADEAPTHSMPPKPSEAASGELEHAVFCDSGELSNETLTTEADHCSAQTLPDVEQLLRGWLSSVRTEECCHRWEDGKARDGVGSSSHWVYTRNVNACWRLCFLARHSAIADCRLRAIANACDRCAFGSAARICSCEPNPWQPLPDSEPDGSDPQFLLNEESALHLMAPPGLAPGLENLSVWRHLLRGTHAFSLDGGPEPVSLCPDAPEVAAAARRRQRNAGWRRWWLTYQKTKRSLCQQEHFPVTPTNSPRWAQAQAHSLQDATATNSRPFANAGIEFGAQLGLGAPSHGIVFLPVPVHLAVKVSRYVEQLQSGMVCDDP